MTQLSSAPDTEDGTLMCMLVNMHSTSALLLQKRDLSILRGLFESRVMTLAQAADIFFEGKREAAKKRIQKLKAAGFIAERTRRAYEPSILCLSTKALEYLRDQGVLADYPDMPKLDLESRATVSEQTIRHELDVMDVKAGFHTAIRTQSRYTIAEFGTWPARYQFRAKRGDGSGEDILVKPDGFLRIHEREDAGGLSEHTFFLEVDRSTETQDTLVNRALCYLDYYRSGGFAVRSGADRAAYKEYPFRVLMVFKTAERRNNAADRLARSQPPVLTLASLSTLDEVTRDPLGPVWLSPADYRASVAGTSFDIERPQSGALYKRQSERERLVEQRARMHAILSDVAAQ